MFISQTAQATLLEERETKAVKDSAQYSAVLNAKAKAEATRDSLYQQIAIIKSIDDSRYLWSHLMYEISNALPQYTWLTRSHSDEPAARASRSPTPRQEGGVGGQRSTMSPRQRAMERERAKRARSDSLLRRGEGGQVQDRRAHRRHSGAHAIHEVARGVAVHTERAARAVRPGSGRRKGSHGVHSRGGDASSPRLRDKDSSTRSLGGALTWQSVANMTKREQTLAASDWRRCCCSSRYWYFLYKPKAAELAVTQAHVDSLDKKNQQAKADIAQGSLQKLKAQSAEYEQSLRVMRQLVPRSNEVPALLEDISTAARRVGLDLATVEPMPVLPGEQFDTYRYKLAVIGGYHPVGPVPQQRRVAESHHRAGNDGDQAPPDRRQDEGAREEGRIADRHRVPGADLRRAHNAIRSARG